MKKSIVAKFSLFACVLMMLFTAAACSNENREFMTEEEMQAYRSVYESGLTGTIKLAFVREFETQADVNFEAEVKFELSYSDAPITVTNFVNLVKEGFYNSPTGEKENPLTMESIGSDYALFGSKKFQIVYDEDGNEEIDEETGNTLYEYKSIDTEYTIRGEFKSNGWKTNTIDFTKGNVLFMYLSDTTDYDSAFCQFGITTGNSSSDTMKGNYAAFGRVVSTSVYRIGSDGQPGNDLGTTFDELLSTYIQSIDNTDRDTVVKIVSITLDGNYELGATRKLNV